MCKPGRKSGLHHCTIEATNEISSSDFFENIHIVRIVDKAERMSLPHRADRLTACRSVYHFSSACIRFTLNNVQFGRCCIEVQKYHPAISAMSFTTA
jgi:hypothetical protein